MSVFETERMVCARSGKRIMITSVRSSCSRMINWKAAPQLLCENGRDHLRRRAGSEELFKMELKKNSRVSGYICFGKRAFSAHGIGYIMKRDSHGEDDVMEALRLVAGYAFYSRCTPAVRGMRSQQYMPIPSA